jgi:hypothetical protein
MKLFSFVFHLGAVIVQVLNMQCILTTVDLITDNTCHDTFHKLDNFLKHMKKKTHKNNGTMVIYTKPIIKTCKNQIYLK